LSEKKREEIFEEIIKFANEENPKIFFWVWVVDNFLIDQINIRQANKEAMRRSLIEILRKLPPLNPLLSKEGKTSEASRGGVEVFIDWKDNYVFEELEKQATFIIWWDSKVLEISAASIVAKVFRDKLMDTYSLLYPNIWFEKHKGYWTKAHINAISEKKNVTWIHRISYKPVKKILEN
jgi:ribonuclease HII